MSDKKVKGFIAVRMPATVRKRLESVSAKIRDAGVSGEWQQAGAHHLTLKYIGEIDAEKYDDMADALREPCGKLSLPVFTVGPLFTFGSRDDGTVLAARVRPRDKLEKLFRILERTVVENGGPKTKFPSFKPHVTLCYLDRKGEDAWEQAKGEIDFPDTFGELTIVSVPLNESKGKGDDFKIRHTVRVGRRIAYHAVWSRIAACESHNRAYRMIAPSAAAKDIDVLDLIEAAARKYGGGVFGGNCGQFAFGLARFLKDKGAYSDPRIGLIADEQAETEQELQDGEPDIYHVFLQLGKAYYDATGRIDNQYLSAFATEEYGDSTPTLWDDLPLDEGTRRIISFNTNWNLEWADFYRFFDALKPGS